MHHHLAAWHRAPRFDEAQMPRRDVRFGGEQQLAHPAPLPPLAQQFADGTVCPRCARRDDL
jgi:hypothetical protein